MKKLFDAIRVIAAILLLSTPAVAKPKKRVKPPKGAIVLPESRVFMTRGVDGPLYCGGKKSYEPGKMVGKKSAFFMPLKRDVERFKKRAKTKRAKKKLKVLSEKLNEAKAICREGPPPADLFAAYAQPLTYEDIYHLYRRAGLGPPTTEAMSFHTKSSSELVENFMTYFHDGYVESLSNSWLDEDPEAPHYPDKDLTPNGLNLYALIILTKTPNHFFERLALIELHDRLATSVNVVGGTQRRMMIDHLLLLRTTGALAMDYPRLIAELGEDPLMIRWLTLDRSTNAAPNENYARELMELFTLDTADNNGAPNYTSQDIAQIAKAFTGWGVSDKTGVWKAVFDPAKSDITNDKVIFKGMPYQGNVKTGRDVVSHIFAKHPNASVSLAKFIAREYFREDLDPGKIANIAYWIKENDFQLRPVFKKLLSSEEFYKSENRFAIAKTPGERFVHLVRIMDRMGMPYDIKNVRNNLAAMGCVVTQPETVFGCDKTEEVPVSQRLLRSANLITSLSNANTLFTQVGWDYSRLMPYPGAGAEDLVTHFEAMFGVTLNAENRASMLDYLNSAMNNQGNLVAERWNPNNNAHIRRKVAGLFRLFAMTPQFHDLR